MRLEDGAASRWTSSQGINSGSRSGWVGTDFKVSVVGDRYQGIPQLASRTTSKVHSSK